MLSHPATSGLELNELQEEPTFEAGTTVNGVPSALLSTMARIGVAALTVTVLFSVWILIRASPRGLDLTDEGIYLNNYRAWRNPQLTFTGAPVIFGPIFQLLGWSIPNLRLVKLALLLGTSSFLGYATVRFVFAHVQPQVLRREKQAIVVCVSILGSLSVYAWLPQSPGYNDLAIMFSALAVALTLFWSTAVGRNRIILACLIGSVSVLLLLVKWPSAVCTAAGITAFIFASGRRKRFPSFLGAAFGGGFTTLVFVQLVAGKLPERVKTLKGSSTTSLQGLDFLDAYVWNYTRNIEHTARGVLRIGGPVIFPCLIVALLLIRRRAVLAGLVYSIGLVLLVARTRYKSYLTGGEINVVQLESTFPIFFLAALGVTVLYLVYQRNRPFSSPADSIPLFQPKSLIAGITLLSFAPLLQAVGTGNPMFRIAFCAGAAWSAAIAALMIVAVERGGTPFLAPAICSLATVCAVGLLPGLQGLWTDSFRVGPLWKQTVSVPSAPEVRGMRFDPATADLIAKTRAILSSEGFVGKPGFSTSNGTGLTYAVGLAQPLAGLFVEEPLPEVLEVRIREACRLGVITASEPPVVLSLGGERPPVATRELQACGIKFPSGYRSFRVKPPSGGYPHMRDEGITVWLPTADSAKSAAAS